MDFWMTATFISALVLGAGLFLLVRRMAFRAEDLPVTAEWINELSIERYRPMMRLLDGGDMTFLRTQPGFTPGMAGKIRQQRCQIFRGYLRCLNADFARVCTAIKVVMLQSKHDRPDLATALIHQQVRFGVGMMLVNLRLALYRVGVCGVDVADLVDIFDSMRLELRSLVPSAVSMAA